MKTNRKIFAEQQRNNLKEMGIDTLMKIDLLISSFIKNKMILNSSDRL